MHGHNYRIAKIPVKKMVAPLRFLAQWLFVNSVLGLVAVKNEPVFVCGSSPGNVESAKIIQSQSAQAGVIKALVAISTRVYIHVVAASTALTDGYITVRT